MRIAMSSAVETLRSGTTQLDRGAAGVQRATAFALPPEAPAAPAATPAPAPAPAAPPAGTAATGGQPLGEADLLSAMTDLVLSRTTVGAGAATARAADDAYRAVLELGRR